MQMHRLSREHGGRPKISRSFVAATYHYERVIHMRSLRHVLRRFALCAIVMPSLSCSTGSAHDSPRGVADSARGAALGTMPRARSSHDWTRFGWDAARSSASPDSTGISASNAGTLRRQQVTIDGTVDASAIYLHDVQVGGGGASHDVFFVTTTYGKT